MKSAGTMLIDRFCH